MLKEIAAGGGDLTHRLDASNEDEIGELSQANQNHMKTVT
ncbi:HAMP domain-containing protein [Moritella yayanosii]